MRFLAAATFHIVSLVLSVSLIAAIILFAAREFLISYLEEDNA